MTDGYISDVMLRIGIQSNTGWDFVVFRANSKSLWDIEWEGWREEEKGLQRR